VLILRDFGILLFTQQKLLAPNWKNHNAPAWVNSR